MLNSTRLSYFTLAAFFDTGSFRYLIFLAVMLLYVSVVCANVLLIAVICTNRRLQEPMCLFLCSLFVNELFGSSAFFPPLLLQILSDVHTVPASCCFLQIYCLYTYANVQFCNLGVMSYDRYLAICCPLQYNTRMTPRRISILVFLVWFCPAVEVAVMLYLSARLRLCGNVINKVFCDNYSIVRLSCSDTTVNNVYGLVYMFTLVFSLIILILYTYIKILTVCFYGSNQTRHKALNTCAPHLASLLNFAFGCFFETVQGRFDMSRAPNMLRIFLSVYFLTVQPLFNPLLYGLKTSKIRTSCKHLFFRKT